MVGSDGGYGLRLDQLGLVDDTFSTQDGSAAAFLSWNGLEGISGEASITGTLYHSELGLVNVSHIFTGISAVSEGFEATGGDLVLTYAEGINIGNVIIDTDSRQNGDGIGFTALGDSHRCAGHSGCGPFVARGWLEPDGSTDDWLVQLQPVPVPAAFPLFASAMLALFGLRRKKA